VSIYQSRNNVRREDPMKRALLFIAVMLWTSPVMAAGELILWSNGTISGRDYWNVKDTYMTLKECKDAAHALLVDRYQGFLNSPVRETFTVTKVSS
jgi:hypothetical protein